MFQDNLFSIVSERKADNRADFTIRLNGKHPIYTGHFPNEAITPGVCIVQMAVDLFSHTAQQEHHLVKAKNVKFLQIIRPDEHPEIHYMLTWEKSEEGFYVVKVLVDDGAVTFSKMSLQLGAK
jgi:3-hydroxyacyl-[acyl-carrier-protein] dehydratase